MGHGTARGRGERGLSTGVSLVALMASLLIVAVLVLMSANVFGGGTGTAGGHTTSILSTSSPETQLKLCSEGRDSTYGDPPTASQQAKCLQQLAGQIGGSGLSGGGVP
ncbi:MAG TPA: hypothetical protein VMB72_11395 [Acidimicrobiales bacterium]|nr:hypothetical protein [Acidimicrobiales bacterium]